MFWCYKTGPNVTEAHNMFAYSTSIGLRSHAWTKPYTKPSQWISLF